MSKPPRHLHVFGISLLLIVAALALFLFGVTMESTVPGTGLVSSRELVELRAKESGVWEPGSEVVVGRAIPGGTRLGQVRNGDKSLVLTAPDSQKRWQILEIVLSAGQPATSGMLVLTLAPLEVDSDRIADLQIRLDIDEKHFGAIQLGQEVRLQSNMYHPRTHGTARGKIERLEPTGEAGPNGARRFHGWVKVEHSPFPMLLGSSVKAEVLVGQKRTYQIILEH